MAKPLPLPVWDRQRRTLVQEWMDDHQPHYESEPQRSFTQWVKSQPVYDRLYALYQNSRLSSREIEPLIRKYQIDMARVRAGAVSIVCRVLLEHTQQNVETLVRLGDCVATAGAQR